MDELLEILAKECVMTLAMCKGGHPYLVSLDYAYDPKRRSLYFHCASEGKKVDYLKANKSVWGQVVEDNGLIPGKCDHAFRSVHFGGEAVPVTGIAEKRRALEVMIEKMVDHPAKAKKRLTDADSVRKVAIYRVKVREMTGKKRAR